MVSGAMKNLSSYVTYEDFLKIEKAAKEYENTAVLKGARKGDYSLLIRLLFFTGARIAEIVGTPRRLYTQCLYPGYQKRKGNCLKWSYLKNDNVCIEDKCPHLTTYILKEHHGIRVKDIIFRDRIIAVYGKSVNSDELKARTVVIDQKTLDIIDNHIKKHSLNSNDKIINLNENGSRTFINKLRKKIALHWVSAHKFRHGHAIHCIQHGMDIRTLQQQLGHVDLGTTAIYLQFAVDDRKKAFDKVFTAKPNHVKIQCPSCGFTFRLKKNRDIELEDKIKTVFD